MSRLCLDKLPFKVPSSELSRNPLFQVVHRSIGVDLRPEMSAVNSCKISRLNCVTVKPSLGVGPLVKLEPACLIKNLLPAVSKFARIKDLPDEYTTQPAIDHGGVPILVGRDLVLVSEYTELFHQHRFIEGSLRIAVVLDPFLTPDHRAGR